MQNAIRALQDTAAAVRLRMRSCVIALGLSLASSLGAIDYADFDAKTHTYNLVGKLRYYVEEYNAQQPHEALELLQKGYFARVDGAQLSLGYMTKAVWVAVAFDVRNTEGQPLLLELLSPIDSIEFNYLSERGLILDSVHTGRDAAVNTRPIAHRNFIFPLARAGVTTKSPKRIVLMRLATQGRMFVPLRLGTENVFYARDHLEQIGFGVFFGVMLAMLLYNLFLYIAFRTRAYAFYVFFVVFIALLQFSCRGFLQEIFLPTEPRIAKYLLPVFLHAATIFQWLFAAQFFAAQDKVRTLYRISGWVSFATFVSLVVGLLLPYRYFSALGIVFGSLATFLVFITAGILLLKREKKVRFFICAYILIIGSIALLILQDFDLKYSTAAYMNINLIATALAAMLLSLSLADKRSLQRS